MKLFEQETLPSIIAEATRLTGHLILVSRAHVFGIVEGDIKQQSLESLHLGKTSWVHGCISAHGPVIVEGRVDGDIEAMTKVRLLPTAVVKGSVRAPLIEVRPGAVLNGKLSMGMDQRANFSQQAA